MDPFTIAIIALAVSAAASMLLVKRPSPRKPEAFEDLDFPQFEEGTRQTVCFGDCWTSGWMVLWYGNYRTTKIKAGGKK